MLLIATALTAMLPLGYGLNLSQPDYFRLRIWETSRPRESVDTIYERQKLRETLQDINSNLQNLQRTWIPPRSTDISGSTQILTLRCQKEVEEYDRYVKLGFESSSVFMTALNNPEITDYNAKMKLARKAQALVEQERQNILATIRAGTLCSKTLSSSSSSSRSSRSSSSCSIGFLNRIRCRR